VLTGEMLLAVGRIDEGNALLSRLARSDNDAGMRAAWLLATEALEAGKREEARLLIHAQPRLERDVIGKELLARIDLAEGDQKDADQRYAAISSRSLEARAYLAREAYAHQDWQKAQALTIQMLEEMPDDMTLRANLQAINTELAKQHEGKR